MNAEQKRIYLSVKRLLKRRGAHRYTILHTPVDANGQPSGPEEAIGELYGISFVSSGAYGGLTIDIPGIATGNTESPMLYGLMLSERKPCTGDRLMHGTQRTDILGVKCADGVLYNLRLREEL